MATPIPASDGVLTRFGEGTDLWTVAPDPLGYAKVHYRGLAKNTARLTMLRALGNLWMARRRLLQAQG